MRILAGVAILCLLMPVGCRRSPIGSPPSEASPPNEKEAEKVVQESLLTGTEEWRLFKILKVHKTTISEVAGHKGLYFADMDCDIEFVKECYWKEGYMWANPVPVSGQVMKKKGDQGRGAGRFVLEKTEKGWEVK